MDPYEAVSPVRKGVLVLVRLPPAPLWAPEADLSAFGESHQAAL